MTRYSTTMSEILATIREGFSPKEIKMAIGVATDKRYKGGNYSGAVNAIEKIKKGLSDHPQVKAVLKRVNEAPEDMEPASPDEGSMADQQLEFIAYAAEEIKQHIANGGEFPEWMQNKLAKVNGEIQSLHANINHDNVQDQKEAKVECPKCEGKGCDHCDNKGYHITEGAFSELQIAAKDLAKYAVKSGGVDKNDFMKAAAMMKTGKIKELGKFTMDLDTEPRDKIIDMVKGAVGKSAAEKLFNVTIREEVELEEGKSSTGYELYHKDFSTAMQHAYDFAKKKFGIEVDPKEIDDKVASGPRKPSKGKTNSYRLLGKDGKKAIQVQVYGMDNGKYELNMYKEEVELEEAMATWKVTVVKPVNKLKKGDSVSVKANNIPQALKKSAKAFGDSNLVAVPSIHFDVQKEEVELEEKLKVSDGLGAWITDFHKSDAPQFAGKSKEERQKMAIAAFVDAGGKLESVNEEEEPQKPDTAKAVDQMRDDKKKTRIAQLQLQIAKAQETINKLNAQEKPNG